MRIYNINYYSRKDPGEVLITQLKAKNIKSAEFIFRSRPENIGFAIKSIEETTEEQRVEDFLTHSEKQAVLYSKGHFKVTNTIDDLKVIVSHQFVISVDSVEVKHVYHFLIRIFMKLKERNYIVEDWEEFLKGLFSWQTPTLNIEIMIDKLLSYFSSTEVEGMGLGDADPSYLTISKGNLDEYIEDIYKQLSDHATPSERIEEVLERVSSDVLRGVAKKFGIYAPRSERRSKVIADIIEKKNDLLTE